MTTSLGLSDYLRYRGAVMRNTDQLLISNWNYTLYPISNAVCKYRPYNLKIENTGVQNPWSTHQSKRNWVIIVGHICVNKDTLFLIHNGVWIAKYSVGTVKRKELREGRYTINTSTGRSTGSKKFHHNTLRMRKPSLEQIQHRKLSASTNLMFYVAVWKKLHWGTQPKW